MKPTKQNEDSITPLDLDAEERRQAVIRAEIPPLEALSVDAAREMLKKLSSKVPRTAPEGVQIENIQDGPIDLRLYRTSSQNLPVIIFCHGGGWVLRTLDDYDDFCSHLAAVSGHAVFSVDYRLAPEHKFPAAIDDTCEAIRWIVKKANSFNVNQSKLIYAGDSAGANLAAVAALHARNGELPAPRLQVLLYPITDSTRTYPSHTFDLEGLMLSGKTMEWFCGHYLDAYQESDWRASPLLADSLKDAAPCYLMTAGADPLRDEGIAYAQRLMFEGCTVKHSHFPGQAHGFLTASPSGAQTQQVLLEIKLAIASL